MTISLAAIHGIHRHFRDLHGESVSPRPLMMRYAEERYAAYGKHCTCGHKCRLGIGILLPSVGVIVYNSPQHASCKRRDAKSQTRPSGCLQRLCCRHALLSTMSPRRFLINAPSVTAASTSCTPLQSDCSM